MTNSNHSPVKIENNQLIVYGVAIIAALAGLLFGIDIGVISGALKFITQEFNLSLGQQQFVVSSVLIGAVLGTFISNPISYHYGRHKAILISAVIFGVGALLSAFAPNYYFLIIVRILLGTALGIASFTAPIYLSEVSPKRIRGGLISLYQLMITIGILCAFVSDTYFSDTGSWRWMLGIIFIPSFIMFVGVLTLPRSPRWLMLMGHRDQALSVLKKILQNPHEVEEEMRDIEENLRRAQDTSGSALHQPYFKRVLAMGIVLQTIQILTGMNTMMYYAPKIYQLAGFVTTHQQMWGTVLLGVLNVLTTILALFMIDRWGRRPLCFFGLTLMTIGMSLLGLAFYLNVTSTFLQYMAIAGMLVFVFGFAISLGPVIWVLCAEIFPLRNRDFGVMCTTATNWLCCALLGGTFLTVINLLGTAGTFWMLAGICLVSMIFIYFFAPETKNISLETLERHLVDGKPLRQLGRHH